MELLAEVRAALTTVEGLLAAGTAPAAVGRVAVTRHGQPAVVRVLARAERAPGSIAAF